MKLEEFPWRDAGPEPRLPADFASRVIEQARRTQLRKRRTRIELAATAGLATMLAAFLWIRALPSNQPRLTPDPFVASTPTTSDFGAGAWSYQPTNDPLAALMPTAQQVRKFDAYYGTGSWDTYASWDPDSYDSSRTYGSHLK